MAKICSQFPHDARNYVIIKEVLSEGLIPIIGFFWHPTLIDLLLSDQISILRKNTLPRVRFEPEALDYRTSRLPQTDGLTTKLPIKITEFNFKDVSAFSIPGDRN
uniref:Uncharacterized protein n=1 Tax=Cacopsylla melanoneura TaxID=428564 RepID=A0A8D8V3E8_9HEMI